MFSGVNEKLKVICIFVFNCINIVGVVEIVFWILNSFLKIEYL